MAKAANRRPMSSEQKVRAEAADYDVGFGKAPTETRFQAGRSGNPTGRPKGKSTGTLLKELLDQQVGVNLNGRPQTLSFREALVQITGATGLKGGAREREYLLKLIEKFAPEEFQDPPKKQITPERAEIMARFRSRLQP